MRPRWIANSTVHARRVSLVERNNHGHAILEALTHSFHYPRIYRHTPPGDAASAAQAGWPANEHTKSHAVQTLGEALRAVPGMFASRRLLEQCRGFSYGDNGTTGALPGAHDDLVMAAAMALAARKSSSLPQLLAWDPSA